MVRGRSVRLRLGFFFPHLLHFVSDAREMSGTLYASFILDLISLTTNFVTFSVLLLCIGKSEAFLQSSQCL